LALNRAALAAVLTDKTPAISCRCDVSISGVFFAAGRRSYNQIDALRVGGQFIGRIGSRNKTVKVFPDIIGAKPVLGFPVKYMR